MTDHPIPITLAEVAARTGRTPEMMAAAIKGRIEGLGSCERQDLLRDGFDARDIAWYWPEAYDMACTFARASVTALPAAAALASFTGFVFCLGMAIGMGGA